MSVEAFRRGELSLDQMATIARHAPAWTDAQSRDIGTVMTVSQLRHVLQKYPFPELDHCGHEVVDPSSDDHEQAALQSDADDAQSAEASRRREADAVDEYRSMWQDDDGSYRLSGRLAAIIERRDHGVCRVPGCDTTLGLEVHHLVHWEHGGPTDTDNLLLVCGKHHRMHHRGRLDITGNADQPTGIEFRNEHGRLIKPSGAAPNLPTGPPPKPAAAYSHPDGGRLDARYISFDPPRPYYDDLHERTRSDAEYLRRIQPPGLR